MIHLYCVWVYQMHSFFPGCLATVGDFYVFDFVDANKIKHFSHKGVEFDPFEL